MLYYTLLYYTILYFTDISLYICWAIMSNNREMGQIHRNFTSSQGWISGPQVVAVTEPHLFPHGSWHGPPPRQHPETLSALGAWRAQDLVAGDPCRCCLWFWGFLSHEEHRNHPKSAEKPWFWDHFVVFFEKFREGMRFKWGRREGMDENGDKPLDGMEDHMLQQTHCWHMHDICSALDLALGIQQLHWRFEHPVPGR